MVRLRPLALGSIALAFAACPRPADGTAVVDAAVAVEVRDAGPLVTEARLEAWLRYQAALAQVPTDGGFKLRAKRELELLADAGLTAEQVDALEAVVAAVVTERSVARLQGADALAQFKAGLQQLGPEQRAKAEAALEKVPTKAVPNPLAGVEAEYGPEAVRVVLTREAEVTKTWDALLEARGEKK